MAIKKILLIAAGWIFVATGVVGIFLPLLPTTPFLLLAAACFSRSSEKLHTWLIEHKQFGHFVRDWERHRVIPRRAKILSSTMMTVMIGYPVFVYPHPWWFKAFLVFTCLAVSRFIWSCPHEAPGDETDRKVLSLKTNSMHITNPEDIEMNRSKVVNLSMSAKI